MPLTEAQARSLVGTLESELRNRIADIERNERYYRGEQKLAFASEQFKQYHGDRYKDFSDNWVQVVADSPVERLTVNGFQVADAIESDRDLWRVWTENGLDADSQLGFLASVMHARAFALVWGDPDDEDTPIVTFEDPSQCVIAYEPGSRRKRVAALKRWQDGEREFATLYLPDEVWKFERTIEHREKSPQLASVDEELSRWNVRGLRTEPNPQPNPMGVVPMIEFRNRPLLASDPISDVSGVIPMQDAINLLWSQLFTASDYASFPQRVVLGAERPMMPILDETGQVVGERPIDLEKFALDRVLFITGESARIAEWQAANLAAYTDVIEVAVSHLAAQTRTPQHYLIGKMANLSADALIAAETGLVKRVTEKQVWFGQALRELFALICLAQGLEGKARAAKSGTVMWADAESRSHAQLTDSLLKLKAIGFPFEWLALRYGLTPQEVSDLIAMKEREAELDPLTAITGQMGGNPALDVTEAPQEPGSQSLEVQEG